MNERLYPVAILAGGLATRMRPLTEATPKALLDVNGEPFIDHQLRLLASRGLDRVVLCVGHLGERIEAWVGDGRRYKLDVRYAHDGPRLRGTAGALMTALPLLGEAFFVLYGDSYLPCDFLAVQRRFQEAGGLGLMTVFRNEARWDASNVHFENGRILAYDKVRRTAQMRHIDYGLGVLRRDAFADAPENVPSNLANLYACLLARGQLAAFEVPERFYEIGSFDGLRDLAEHLRAA
jgi:NDP-sugar pyrophosphorylase family protein